MYKVYILNYRRTEHFRGVRVGFITDAELDDSRESQNRLWICKKELGKFFPELKGSEKIRLFVSSTRKNGYSRIQMNPDPWYRDVTISVNGQVFKGISVAQIVRRMVRKLTAEWKVKDLYFKFYRMD